MYAGSRSARKARSSAGAGGSGGVRRHDTGQEGVVARQGPPCDDRRGPQARVSQQDGFDLARLDPETAHLDLSVEAASELEGAIRKEATRSPVR